MMGFTVEFRHLIESCETAETVVLDVCIRCFLKKRWNVNGLKTMIKKLLAALALLNDCQVMGTCNRPACTSVADHT